MKTGELVGQKLESILAYPSRPIHPAWADDSTPSINSWAVFLRLEGGFLLCVSPCEVELSGEPYPALGLALELSESAVSEQQPDGRIIEAIAIEKLPRNLPQEIVGVEESDPLEEGATSQYTIRLESGDFVTIKHIMPPMMLGISIAYAE